MIKIYKVKKILSILLFYFIGFNIVYSQTDTNYYTIDFIELIFEDSSEKLVSLEFTSLNDTLIFSDISECKMIGINRNSKSQLLLTTTKFKFQFENLNAYINFNDAKFKIWINIPIHHNNCIDAFILEPSGSILAHEQCLQHGLYAKEKTCIEIISSVSEYIKNEVFTYNSILE